MTGAADPGGPVPRRCPGQARPPHILILMPDQHRADCLSSAGHPVVRTPHLDRLAAEGVRFEQAVTTSPICMSARACFVSGRYSHNHGLWTNRGRLPPDDETVFHHLQRAGYQTAYIGKSHFYQHRAGDHLRDHEPYMHARGLEYVHETAGPWATAKTRSYMTDRWEALGLYEAYRADYARRREDRMNAWPSPLPVEEHADSYVGREAERFIRERRDGRPLCLFVGFGGPHEPFDAPGEYAAMVDPAGCPAPIPAEPLAEGLPRTAREYLAAARRAFARDGLTPAALAAVRANYYGKIALIDRWIGRILQAMAERGWLDDTFVVFWSDHGEMAGDHGLMYKSVFYESSVRVPLVLRWPGNLPAGEVRLHLAETVDLFDTILDAAGCEPSRRSMGRSLLAAARDPAAALRDGAFSEIAHPRPQSKDDGDGFLVTMVRTHEHKLAMSHRGEPLMLFDLERDPLEQRNLLADPASARLRDGLARRIHEWLLGSQDCL